MTIGRGAACGGGVVQLDGRPQRWWSSSVVGRHGVVALVMDGVGGGACWQVSGWPAASVLIGGGCGDGQKCGRRRGGQRRWT